jgi:hypothetical protein
MSKGVTPVAILGTADFDVSSIDMSTVRLEGVKAKRGGYEDVATPYMGNECGCTEAGPDGYMDLTLKFGTAALTEALFPFESEYIPVTIQGFLVDGTPFYGQDCVAVKPANLVDSEVEVDGKILFRLAPTSEPRAQVQIVKYSIPEAAPVELTVYDVAGRVVKRLVQTSQAGGEYTTKWDVQDVPSGVYFYRLQAGVRTTTLKTLVIH